MRAEAKKPIKSRKTGAKLYASTASRLLVALPSSASAKFHPHLSRPCQNPGNLWFSRVFSVFRLNKTLVLPGVHTKAWEVLILQGRTRRFLRGTSQLQKGRGKRKNWFARCGASRAGRALPQVLPPLGSAQTPCLWAALTPCRLCFGRGHGEVFLACFAEKWGTVPTWSENFLWKRGWRPFFQEKIPGPLRFFLYDHAKMRTNVLG